MYVSPGYDNGAMHQARTFTTATVVCRTKKMHSSLTIVPYCSSSSVVFSSGATDMDGMGPHGD
jgi:hypothetical protein